MEMFDIIKRLDDKEKDRLIEQRLIILKNKESKEIGALTDTIVYDGFLDEKIKYNITTVICYYEQIGYATANIGSVIYDDKTLYKTMIKEIKDCEDPYTLVFKTARSYLNLNKKNLKVSSLLKKRNFAFRKLMSSQYITRSIKYMRRKTIGTCTEIASISQNLFRVLGIESDVVLCGDYYELGTKNTGSHAYNIIYPFGRDKAAILFDASATRFNNPAVYYLDEEKKEALYSNKTVLLTKEDAINGNILIKCPDYKYEDHQIEYSIIGDVSIKGQMDYQKKLELRLSEIGKN